MFKPLAPLHCRFLTDLAKHGVWLGVFEFDGAVGLNSGIPDDDVCSEITENLKFVGNSICWPNLRNLSPDECG